MTPCLQVNNESLAISAYQNISRIAITLTSAEHSWFPGRVGMIHHLLKTAQPHFLPSSRASKLPLRQPVVRWEGPAHLWPGRGRPAGADKFSQRPSSTMLDFLLAFLLGTFLGGCSSLWKASVQILAPTPIPLT